MTKLKFISVLTLLGLLLMVGLGVHQAFAQDAGQLAADAGTVAAPVLGSVSDLEFDPSAILGAIQSGKWLWAFGAILVLAVKFLRPWFAKKVEWFGTSLGGKVFAFGCAFLMTLGDALGSGNGLSMAMLGTTFTLAWVAAGQHDHARDVAAKAKE